MIPAHLIGASPFAVAQSAGLALSPGQAAILKCLAKTPEPLTSDEHAAFAELTGASFVRRKFSRVQPRKDGYRECWVRAGRQSGKSLHIAAPFAVSALLTPGLDALLAPGQQARVVCIAPTLAHLRQLQDGICGVLDRLGFKFTRRDREIEVEGLRAFVDSAVADHIGPRGGTALAAIVDEGALLPFEDEADGRDVEVFGALKPSLAVTRGKLLVISSPWARQGLHYDTVEKNHGHPGNDVLAICAPSWKLNPILSEAYTHMIEPDERRWRREFGAEPGENDDAFLSQRDVKACVDVGVRSRPPHPTGIYFGAIDLAFTGAKSRAALAICHREISREPGSAPIDRIIVDVTAVWNVKSVPFETVIADMTAILNRYKVVKLLRDSLGGAATDIILKQRGARSEQVDMSPKAQAARFDALATSIRLRRIRLLDHDDLVRELCDLRQRLHQSGRVEYGAPNRTGHHDDLPDALVLAVEAALAGPPSGESDVIQHPLTGRFFQREYRAEGGSFFRECPPPYGAEGFEEHAAAQWAKGAIDADVERWAKERGLYQARMDAAMNARGMIGPTSEEAPEFSKRVGD